MKKQAYILHASDEQLDMLIDVGVESFILAAYNMPPAPPENIMPTWERTQEILYKFQGKVKLLLAPVWFQNWYTLPADQQFVDKKARRWVTTPCPSSSKYFSSRFEPIENLWDDHLIDGVVWDIEDYEVPGSMDFFSRDEMPDCYCNRCNDFRAKGISPKRFFRDQWQFYMRPYDYTGFMPYSVSWVTALFPPDATWYCQKTYSKNKYWNLWKKKIGGLENNASAGVWLEHHKPGNLKGYVVDVMSRKPWGCGYKFNSVWFYTHRWLKEKDISEYHTAIRKI